MAIGCTCSGEQDLADFLTQSLEEDVQARHLDELVRPYHDELRKNGVSSHTVDDLDALSLLP